jgi:tetratricopeptide (TPR) repeat protein
VQVWEADGGRELWKADGNYYGMSFSPDGRLLAAGGHKGGARVWEAESGRELWKTDGSFFGVSFSPDSKYLAVGGLSGLRLFGGPWELPKLRELRRRGIEANRISWHQYRAAESETAGNWFAAEFHRRWLTRIQPASGQACYQHGMSLARLGRQEESKQEFVTALELKTSLLPLTAADCHAMLGQWKEAVELYSAQATPEATNVRFWEAFARLALVSGGPAGYRSACEKMVKQFSATTDAATANSTAWVCAMGPDALPDMTPVVGLARLGVKAAPENWYYHGTLGAVLYRTGRFEEVVKELESAIRLHGKGGSPLDHLILAMAHHKLGKTAEAMKSLAAAEKVLDSDPAWFWADRLERQFLHDEATKLIRGK